MTGQRTSGAFVRQIDQRQAGKLFVSGRLRMCDWCGGHLKLGIRPATIEQPHITQLVVTLVRRCAGLRDSDDHRRIQNKRTPWVACSSYTTAGRGINSDGTETDCAATALGSPESKRAGRICHGYLCSGVGVDNFRGCLIDVGGLDIISSMQTADDLFRALCAGGVPARKGAALCITEAAWPEPPDRPSRAVAHLRPFRRPRP